MPASYGSYSSQIALPPEITIIVIRAHERAGWAVGEDRRMKSPQCESKVVKEHTPKMRYPCPSCRYIKCIPPT